MPALAVVAALLAVALLGGYARWREDRPQRAARRRHREETLDLRDLLAASVIVSRGADHGAELLAVELEADRERFREDTMEISKVIWQKHHEQQLADLNARFDQLNANYDPADPLPASYWPGVRPLSVMPNLYDTMAALDPDATIQMIAHENAAPSVFSWSTGELPLVGSPADRQVQTAVVGTASGSTRTLVRERVAHPVNHPASPFTAPRQDVRRHRRRGWLS